MAAARGSIPAVATTFAVGGALMAQAYARMPTLRDQVGASTGQLGFALVGMGLGSVVAMPFTARIVEHMGSRHVVAGAAGLTAAGWWGLAWVGSPAALGAVMLGLGAGVGVWDVAMNVQGHGVERVRGRSLMPRLHAAYSAGTLLGALLGAVTAHLGLSLRIQFPVSSAIALGLILIVTRAFVPDSASTTTVPASADLRPSGEGQAQAGQARETGRARPKSRVTGLEILIGLMTLSTAVGEGAANDWLALLLVDTRHAPEAWGALTFAAFNCTMLVGRLAGGPAIERWGRVAVLRASGVCAGVGVVVACLVPSVGAALIGGLLWGLGLATVFPATMSAAGDVPGRGQRAIGVVATIGYGGFLLGAPTIGLAASVVGLDRALLLVAGFAGLIVVLAPAAAPRAASAKTVSEPDTGLLR